MENVTLSMSHCSQLASGPGPGPADDRGPHWGPGCYSVVCGFFQCLYRQERSVGHRGEERRWALCSGDSLHWVMRQVAQEDPGDGGRPGTDREQGSPPCHGLCGPVCITHPMRFQGSAHFTGTMAAWKGPPSPVPSIPLACFRESSE